MTKENKKKIRSLIITYLEDADPKKGTPRHSVHLIQGLDSIIKNMKEWTDLGMTDKMLIMNQILPNMTRKGELKSEKVGDVRYYTLPTKENHHHDNITIRN